MLGTILLVVVGTVLVATLSLWVFGERGRLMRPSTWQLIRQGGLRRVLNGDFFHAYFYGRWTNQYISRAVNSTIPRLKPPVDGDRRWADTYHGKVLPLELAEMLITVEEDIPLRDLEQIIPYPSARELVLTGPPDVVVYECGCRHARPDPCLPTQVCMVVGQPFADFVLEHNPRSSRRVTQIEALEILRAEHERGHLHAAYFREVMLNRFYAICNCCQCCCGGIQSMVRGGVPMVASSGYVAQVDEENCERCGRCEDACAFAAIEVGQWAAVVDWEACMGCGVCVGQCRNDAVSLVRDARKGVPLDVRALA